MAHLFYPLIFALTGFSLALIAFGGEMSVRHFWTIMNIFY